MKNDSQIAFPRSISTIVSIAILFFSIIYLSFRPSQSDFPQILFFGSVAFAAYYFLVFIRILSFEDILISGVVIRLCLLFTFPNLSDDIYRFVWDGHLTKIGLNPYGYMPSEIIEDLASTHMSGLFDNMNSPDYYTIYPPLTQLIFYISNLFGDNVWVSSLIIKICFLIAEIFTFFGLIELLKFCKKDIRLSSIYFLNPLIIVEGIGNLHFEIIMVCFLVWSIYFLFIKRHIFYGALFLTLSIASKLLPLMFLPYFLFHLESKSRIRFFGWGLFFMIIAFLPIILGLDFANFGSSIDLYFQKFEFNGGIYYLLRYLGQLYSGYNLIHTIGPFLGLSAVSLIIWKAFKSVDYEINTFIEYAFFSFCTYLFLATTIHPWYLIIPILFSVFVRWRFAVLWSFLILLTYINYSYDPYHENLWIVTLEYSLVFAVLFYEFKYKYASQPKLSEK